MPLVDFSAPELEPLRDRRHFKLVPVGLALELRLEDGVVLRGQATPAAPFPVSAYLAAARLHSRTVP